MAGAVKESLVPIKHADNEWAVRQRIELAPANMVIRELLQNAIESSRLLSNHGHRQIRLGGVDLRSPAGDEVRKLAIWNRGPGMGADKLLSILDLAASGDEKQQGVDANYGVGAKTAGLKASPEGLRYRSCHEGRVSEAVICCRRNRYGKLKIQLGGEWHEVWDATDACEREGVPLHFDWTEVVLMGMDPSHDTVADLFIDPDSDAKWLVRSINERFYDLSDVEVIREPSATAEADTSDRRLLGLKAIPTQRDEIVSVTFGGRTIGIRYGIVEQRSASSASKPAGRKVKGRMGYSSHGCIVFQNECFDYHQSLHWRRVAPRFGIAHGQGAVFVHVLIPDKFPVAFDQYRQTIEDLDRKHKYCLEDFQEAIFDNRPQWLIDYIASQAPAQLDRSDALKKRLRDLEEYLKWYRELYKYDEAGDQQITLVEPNELPDGPIGPDPPQPFGEVDGTGLKPASDHSRRRGTIPKTDWVKGGTSRQRDYMSQRCADYDRQIHRLRLNVQYEGIERAIDMMAAEFQHVHDQATLRSEATVFVKEEIEFRAIKHVMLGLVHESEEHWSRRQVKDAISTDSISIPLSDYRDIASSVRQRLGSKYGRPH